MPQPAYFTAPTGLTIAHIHAAPTDPAAPTLVFLPGYMSDMSGSKATALFDWAWARGHGCLLLDYSGCGQSEGQFAQGTLSRWRAEVVALIQAQVAGPVVLVGSSMGGWLMLLVAEALPAGKVAALVGIAAAPDFTDWGYAPEQKALLAAGDTVLEPNPYGPEPTPTHAAFWADGQANRLLGRTIRFDGPVRLLQGMADADVPWHTAPALALALRSAQVQVHLVKDGDHRLSRPADIALLLGAVADALAAACSDPPC
ncbi:MAG TPA: alpha/beta hydrolase [Novosphingobium sp.]|nr:alpha/beta hydrolase [Novosphingobium sp.]HZV10801.1 alpha/beta hydrolase [Novosphingobium sp.]